MSEPSVEEIVAKWEAAPWDEEQREELAVLIADWRKRGERIAELETYEGIAKALKILSDNGMGGRFS